MCEICVLGRLGGLEGLGACFLRREFKFKFCGGVLCVTWTVLLNNFSEGPCVF